MPDTCRCGKPVQFAVEDRCEDCFSRDSARWNGKSRSVNTLVISPDYSLDCKPTARRCHSSLATSWDSAAITGTA